jgi:AbrB family looped-hinge helix DNA binding protein
MKTAVSKLTSKGQATIPSIVRQRLNIEPGDRVAFTMREDRVEISRAEPIDIEFHRAQESNLAEEWMSAEDEAAYGEL